MKLTYTEITILFLGFTSLYFILKSLGLKWRIEHMEQVRKAKRHKKTPLGTAIPKGHNVK